MEEKRIIEESNRNYQESSGIMINFKEMESPESIWNDGFMFQWCCKCKALHVWHFHITRGRTEDKDFVTISVAGYPKLAKLRKFYEKAMKKVVI